MRVVILFILLNFVSFIASGQTSDTTFVELDTTKFRTVNPFLLNQANYEGINNSFITGSAIATIRSQDNPLVLIDDIPINHRNNTATTEYLGLMNFLTFDIQGVSVQTLRNEDRIISGDNNNSISYSTDDIILGKDSAQFEVNNFTSLSYQDFDTIGYSTIFNFSAKKSYDKIGYRLSLNNGFQNDFFPENGIQRYGGNVKLKYNPVEAVLLTGFLDYTNFNDFKRTGDNTLKSNRLFSYINADISLTDWFTLYGKYSRHTLSERMERVFNNDFLFFGDILDENYNEKNNYNYASSYFDIGLDLNREIVNNTFINFKLGYNQNNLDYSGEKETDYIISDTSSDISRDYFNSRWNRFEAEKVIYTSLKLQNKIISIEYLFNRTNYEALTNLFSGTIENRSFNNHLVSLTFDIIKNENKLINKLRLNATYGILANYAIESPPFSFSNEEVDWITDYTNENIELGLYSSFFKNRIDFSFSVYSKNYDQLFDVGSRSGLILHDIGKVNKQGYDLIGKFNIIQNKEFGWSVRSSFSENEIAITYDDSVEEIPFIGIVTKDTIIKNNIISINNNIRYKNFQLFVDVEGKNGFDINLFENRLSVSKPFSYQQSSQISGINNEGVPTSESIEDFRNYITDTDYLILKTIGLRYQTNENKKGNNYTIGLQYNRLRRIYLYVNDIELYQDQFQKPSFLDSVSFSFKMKF